MINVIGGIVGGDNSYIRGMLAKFGVFKEGHFVFTGGDHSDVVIDKYAVLPRVSFMSELGYAMLAPYGDTRFDVVLSPEVGGTAFGREVARARQKLTTQPNTILALQARKKGGEFVLRSSQGDLIEGKRVLVVEDMLTRGRSARKTVELAHLTGASEVVGVSVLWNRNNVTAEDLGVVRLEALIDEKLPLYPENECPLCKDDVPVNTDVGHGWIFTQRDTAANVNTACRQ